MNTRTLAPSLFLHRSAVAVLFDRVQQRWSQWRLQRREAAAQRLALAVERELMQLDPRTLSDIGAPQGLVGLCRWQEERPSADTGRLLDRCGW